MLHSRLRMCSLVALAAACCQLFGSKVFWRRGGMEYVTGAIVRSIRHRTTIQNGRCLFDLNAMQQNVADAVAAQSRGLGAEDIRTLRQRCVHASQKHLRMKELELSCAPEDVRKVMMDLGTVTSQYILEVMEKHIVEQTTNVRPPPVPSRVQRQQQREHVQPVGAGGQALRASR
eukprot:2407004-Pyramimonas_sp.AAC.1